MGSARSIGRLQRRWRMSGGYHEVLTVALPLVISTGALSVQHVVDRMFLTWYSPETIAAASPAGMLNFAIMSLFFGTASYAATFVAQYQGAGADHRIGPVVWQGMYLALIGGAAHLLFIPLAGPLFAMIGHDPVVQMHETRYFQVLCLGAAAVIAQNGLAAFFSGRGKTRIVMWVAILQTAINIMLDRMMIFGWWFIPEMGITGAGIATNISACCATFAYLILMARPAHRRKYLSLAGWRFDRELFGRLLRYGAPNGAQFFLDIAGFTVFVLLIGRLGVDHLAATNITFNINTLAFLPMIGAGTAISVLVGRYIGEEEPGMAEVCAWSGFHLSLVYMSVVMVVYLFMPWLLIAPFAMNADPVSFDGVRRMTVILLRFMAVFSLFDMIAIMSAGVLKGAGDTRFVMIAIGMLSLILMVIPCAVALLVFHTHMYVVWGIATGYVMILGSVFFARFRRGHWKTMRVIERVSPPVPVMLPETPLVDIE